MGKGFIETKELSKMSAELEEKSLTELADMLQGYFFLSGQANGFNAGWQLAVKIVGQKAGEAFIQKNDGLALILREIKEEIERQGSQDGGRKAEASANLEEAKKNVFDEFSIREKLKN